MRLGRRLPPEFGAEEAEGSVQRDAADGAAAGGDSGIAGHAGEQGLRWVVGARIGAVDSSGD